MLFPNVVNVNASHHHTSTITITPTPLCFLSGHYLLNEVLITFYLIFFMIIYIPFIVILSLISLSIANQNSFHRLIPVWDEGRLCKLNWQLLNKKHGLYTLYHWENKLLGENMYIRLNTALMTWSKDTKLVLSPKVIHKYKVLTIPKPFHPYIKLVTLKCLLVVAGINSTSKMPSSMTIWMKRFIWCLLRPSSLKGKYVMSTSKVIVRFKTRIV